MSWCERIKPITCHRASYEVANSLSCDDQAVCPGVSLPPSFALQHFGRKPEGDFFPWEKADLVADLKAAVAEA